MTAPRHITVVAGEVSADRIGGWLVDRLYQRFPTVTVAGVGGQEMSGAGQQQWFDNSDMAVMGIAEVFPKLGRLLRLRKNIYERALSERTDLFIGIDAPDFNLPLEKKLRQAKIPSFHYVSPSIWAWRRGRAAKISHCCDHLFCLFPFEPALYAGANLVASYVGHPLTGQITSLDKAAARERLGIRHRKPLIALLPGSRGSEIKRNTPVMAATLACYFNYFKADFDAIAPIAHESLAKPLKKILALLPGHLRNSVRLHRHGSHVALQACDAALVASGTATFEALLFERPMLVMYKVHPLSAFIIERTSQTPWVSLPNALAGAAIVPEFLQRSALPEKMALCLDSLLNNQSARRRQIAAFREVKKRLYQCDSAIDIIGRHFQDALS